MDDLWGDSRLLYLHSIFLGNILVMILYVRYSGVRGGDSAWGNGRSCCIDSDHYVCIKWSSWIKREGRNTHSAEVYG